MAVDDEPDEGQTRLWLWASLAPRATSRFVTIGPYSSWQEAAEAADRAPNVLDLDRRIHSAWRVDETEPTKDCEVHRIDDSDDVDDWFA